MKIYTKNRVSTSIRLPLGFGVISFLFLLFSQINFAQTRVIVNPGLEFGITGNISQVDSNFGFGATFDAGAPATSPWYTSHSSQPGQCNVAGPGNCHPIEVWPTNPTGVTAAQGSNFVELNAFESSMIYQNMYLATGDIINYSYRHRARSSTAEQAAMRIEDQNQTLIATVSTTVAPSSQTVWSTNQGSYPFTGASGVYRVGFRALVNGGSPGLGNFLDDIRITLNPLIDLKFSSALSSCEGSSIGNLFLRINGAVTTSTTVAIELVNPANGTAFASANDFTLTAVANSNGTPTVAPGAASNIYLITIPPGNYDGGATPGYASPSNDEDGVRINVFAVNDGITEPTETFRFDIKQQATNGSTNNFVSTSSPIFGDTYYGSTGNFYIDSCIDSDGDGIIDSVDLDDDNDGILDTAEDICTTRVEGAPIYSETFGTGNTQITNPFVIGHSFVAIGPNDGSYTVTRSVDQTSTYTRTNRNSDLDAGYTNVGSGSNNGRYLMININSPTYNTQNQPIFRIPDLPVIVGRNYRFRIDLAGLLDVTPPATGDIPNLQITIRDANNTVLASANSTTLNVLNDDIWRRLILNFTASTSRINIEIANLQVSGSNGNDVGIDNIVLVPLVCDSDGDGIPNSLDTDSDNDGCADAIEGTETVRFNQIHSLTLPVGNVNYAYRGQIKVGADGINQGTPDGIVSNVAGALGVPRLVNNSAGNPAGIGAGVADNTDVPSPTTADIGQGIGTSQNAGSKDAECDRCFRPANTAVAGIDTTHGITALNRAGSNNGNWPMKIKSAYTVMDAKTLGFVINRLNTTQINALVGVQGMAVYDTDLNCLKIFDGTVWSCYTKQTCDNFNN